MNRGTSQKTRVNHEKNSSNSRPAIAAPRLAGKKVHFAGKFPYGAKDRLAAMAEAQQGKIVEELDHSVDFLVLQDIAGGKTVQKKASALNASGAAVQTIDADAFEKLVEPTPDEVLTLIRGGKSFAGVLARALGSSGAHFYHYGQALQPRFTFTGEDFTGLNLEGFHFGQIAFEQCSFANCDLTNGHFWWTKRCDFSRAKGGTVTFGDIAGSKLVSAEISSAQFQGDIASTDFTGAKLNGAAFMRHLWGPAGPRQLNTAECVFTFASLAQAKFVNISLISPDFSGADCSGAIFDSCTASNASFGKSVLRGTSFLGCTLSGADFSGADCRKVNLADSDLTAARFDGADLAECNFRGATLHGVDLSKAKNYKPEALAVGAVGPALRELDKLFSGARRIHLKFQVKGEGSEEGHEIGIDSAGLAHGWGLSIPQALSGSRFSRTPGRTASDAMLLLANRLANYQVRYETVDVDSTKSPTSGKALRDLVINGISEAFAQPIPAAEQLAADTKTYRDGIKEKGAAARAQREEYKRRQEELKKRNLKKVEKTIAKEVGKITDIATFLKALELRADKSKIDKATKMLKAERFQLFNDVTETHLNGVVKSQTDPDLVYACRIESGGGYACCTQNLNICGGLRGSICKHLLVLIIGLVKAGELDPSTIDGWIAKTHDTKPELNKETMGEIFIQYKGAEAGEVDWRPTRNRAGRLLRGVTPHSQQQIHGRMTTILPEFDELRVGIERLRSLLETLVVRGCARAGAMNCRNCSRSPNIWSRPARDTWLRFFRRCTHKSRKTSGDPHVRCWKHRFPCACWSGFSR